MLKPGLYEYSIRQVDVDGNILSSSEVQIEISEPSVNLLVFPNPVVDNMTIEVTNDKPADQMNIKIYDGQGKQVNNIAILDIDLEIGSHKYEMDVSSLIAGIYYINVEIDEAVFTEKVIIVD